MTDESGQTDRKAKPKSQAVQWLNNHSRSLWAVSAIAVIAGLLAAFLNSSTDDGSLSTSVGNLHTSSENEVSLNTGVGGLIQGSGENNVGLIVGSKIPDTGVIGSELDTVALAGNNLSEEERQALESGIGNFDTTPAAARELNDALSVATLVDYLSTASAGYNRLDELWYKKNETVVFRVDLSSSNMLSLPSTLVGETVPLRLPVTPKMSVELAGSAGLDIEPKGRIAKRVSDVSPTTWKWTVTPIGTGEQFLILTTYVHISEGDDTEPHTIKSYEDLIRVNVKLWDRLTMVVSTVQPVWVFAGVVLTALAGAYGWFRRRGWRTDKEVPFAKVQGLLRNRTRFGKKRR